MVNDPVADLIIQLKNAGAAGRTQVVLPHSKLKAAIAQKLEECGFVKSVAKRGKKARKALEIELKPATGGVLSIQGVQRLSKPGRRVYTGSAHIRPVRQHKGVLVLSTPKGILTDAEAKKAHVGGEALFMIW
jgi:small subunit ribosomal protein S8